MRFWDASAVVPLLFEQKQTGVARKLHGADPEMAVWWGTTVECHSAIARMLRQQAIDRNGAAQGMERLHELETEWLEVEPSTGIRNRNCLNIRLTRERNRRLCDKLRTSVNATRPAPRRDDC